MSIIDKIKKRINKLQQATGGKIEKITISEEEAKQLGGRKEINDVKLEVEKKPSVKTDCFAYINKNGHESCYALNKLYCKKENCNFYKKCNYSNEANIPAIEFAIKEYSKNN